MEHYILWLAISSVRFLYQFSYSRTRRSYLGRPTYPHIWRPLNTYIKVSLSFKLYWSWWEASDVEQFNYIWQGRGGDAKLPLQIKFVRTLIILVFFKLINWFNVNAINVLIFILLNQIKIVIFYVTPIQTIIICIENHKA